METNNYIDRIFWHSYNVTKILCLILLLRYCLTVLTIFRGAAIYSIYPLLSDLVFIGFTHMCSYFLNNMGAFVYVHVSMYELT